MHKNQLVTLLTTVGALTLASILQPVIAQESGNEALPISISFGNSEGPTSVSVAIANHSKDHLHIITAKTSATKDDPPFHAHLQRTAGLTPPDRKFVITLPPAKFRPEIDLKPLEQQVYLLHPAPSTSELQADKPLSEKYRVGILFTYFAYQQGDKKTVLKQFASLGPSQAKSVSIASSDPKLDALKVRSTAHIWPSTVSWNKNEALSTRVIQIEVEGTPLPSLTALSTDNLFSVELRVLKPGISYELVVTPKNTTTSGMTGRIDLKMSPTVSLASVTAMVQDPNEKAPQATNK
jgi:hypothetical protein